MNAAHVTAVTALASGGVTGTAIGILLAIFVPGCAQASGTCIMHIRLAE